MDFAMIQPGFFDLENRYKKLDKPDDPSPKIESVVDWEGFRLILKTIPEKLRKSSSGPCLLSVVLMFKTLVLKSFYNLLDG
ncbi:hypothetical protein MNBD_NITROSPINAE03-1355 [hydrothermal vent metagenome]|uniref:Transposase InsH N-terminal domain-containing protein n=1 Tax=hydrothermal vent metagenome TaxID=652676 RepID=A0A3B1CHM5_9ZZZZ